MNRVLKHIISFLCISVIVFSGNTFAQDVNIKPQNDTLDLGEIISIGNRNLTFKDASKISTAPTKKDTAVEISKPNYDVSQIVAPTTFTINSLKPARLKIIDPLEKYYKMYAIAGLGLYLSPKANIYFNSLRSRKWNYGFDAGHFSGNGGIKNVVSSSWGNNNINTWVNRYYKKHSASFNLGYKNNMVHYYGGLDTLSDNYSSLSKEQIKQSVNRFDGSVSIKSFYKDSSDINYSLGMSYSYLNDNYNTSENRLIFNGDAEKWLTNRVLFYAVLDYDFTNNNSISSTMLNQDSAFVPTTYKTNNSLLVLRSSVLFEYENLKTKLGLDLVMDNTKLRVYPIVDIQYPIADQKITPFIGISGETMKNTFSDYFNVNPYTISFAEIINSNQKFRFYGGLKGSFAKRWSYNIAYNYESYKDYALFTNDVIYSYENRFNVIYDDVKLNKFSMAISYHNNEKIKVSLRGEFYNYNTTEQQFAWHKPKSKIDLLINYNLSSKLLFNLNLFYVGERKAIAYDTSNNISAKSAISLDSYVDVNLKFEYIYNSRLSGFIEFNNLLSSNYDLWHNYQVQPFFGLIGVALSF